MKIMKIVSLVLMAVLVFTGSAHAQATATTITSTSVVLAGGTQATTVTVLSTTGMTASTSSAQTFIYIEGEQMQVRAVVSATVLTVIRATGANAVPHPVGSTVYYGTPGNWDSTTGNSTGVFVTRTPQGRCTRLSNQFLPIINPATNELSDCILSPPQGTPTAAAATTGEWSSVSTYQTANAKPYKKLAVSATTYTLLATDNILGINTNVAFTATIPALTGWVGKEYILQHEITGPTTLTIQTSAGQTINGAASITLGGSGAVYSYQGVYIYGDGVNWFARRGDAR